MLSQIILQCGLFDVDISRELSRSIFNSKNAHFCQKNGRNRRIFQNVSFSSISIEPQVLLKSNMTEELLLDKYTIHSLSYFSYYASTAELQNASFTIFMLLYLDRT